jgi:membrane-associated phospholipid phosphatase
VPSLLSIVVLGLGVFGLYGLALGDGGVPGSVDRALLELGDGLRSAWSTKLATLLTHLGSFVVECSAIVAAGCLVPGRRRSVEIAVLLVSFLIVWLAVDVAKEAFGRPRPADPLVGSSKAAFPSGHSAYATAYVGLALVVARAWSRRARVLLVAGAVCLALLVGLTRIYLRVHYWSDVAAGWGLGSAIFAASAMLALTVLRRSGRG